jgi:ATP-binding cassette subfamily C (CFTR/MRP) protein 1
MVSLIYDRTFSLDSEENDEMAALTLMSTDLDRLTSTFQSINEIWARTIEITIGIWLLERRLGWICVAPILIVISKLLSSIAWTISDMLL